MRIKMYLNITSAFVIVSIFLSLTSANNLLKFDCLPEGGNKTQCLQRSCIWEEVTKNLQNQPYCFYNTTDKYGFKVVKSNRQFNVENLTLEAIYPVSSKEYPYANQFGLPSLTFEKQTKTRLRIKVLDNNSTRYEVPVSKGFSKDTEPAEETMYHYSYTKDPFSIQVFARRGKKNVTM